MFINNTFLELSLKIETEKKVMHMLTNYRKEQRKIAMGLLSFHQKLSVHQSLLKEIDTYEQEENLKLLFWVPEGDRNIQGILGIEKETPEAIVLHDISLNPSFRGEGLGFQLLDDLVELYPDAKIYGTLATSTYLSKWKEYK